MFEEEKKKINPLNTYTAWGIYAFAALLAIFGIAAYEIYKLMEKIYTR